MINKKLNILIVNDDGYNAKGLEVLAEVLSEQRIYFSAPLTHQSAKSHSITYDRPLQVQKYKIKNYEFPAINVSGSPIDSLRVGIAYYKDTQFDLVVSGVNNGFNLALDTFYSGTVAAAKEASLFGIKSVALSTKDINDLDLVVLKRWFNHFFTNYYHTDFDVLNVNIPSIEAEKIKGIKKARLDNFYSKTIFEVDGDTYNPLLDFDYKYNLATDGDYNLYMQNYITETKLSFWDQRSNKIKLK